MGVTEKPLVGRSSELRAAERALHRAVGGGSAVLEVRGEPGIGKTRLLSEIAERARVRHFRVLTGRGSELEADLPFAALADALTGALGDDSSAVQSVLEERADELLPVLGDTPPGRSLAAERYRSYAAVAALLGALTTRQPLILVLDDLQWADDASLELLGYLLRRPLAGRLVLVLSHRPRQAPAALRLALAGASDAIVLEPQPLGAGDVAALFADLDVTVREGLLQGSLGNPLALELLANSPDASSGVSAALQAELSFASPQAETLARAAAVVGDPFDLDLAGELAGLTGPALLEALDELAGRDLVRAETVPRRFRFRHPVLRRAVYEGAPTGWRLSAHARAAQALERRGAPLTSQAHHVALSASVGDPEALALLRAAGGATLRRSPATAARFLDAALRILDEPQASPIRIDLLITRATALAVAGQLAESRDAFHDVLSRMPPGWSTARARAVEVCARVEHLLGRHAEASAMLSDALADSPAEGDPDATRLVLELASGSLLRGDFQTAREWAAEMMARVPRDEDRGLHAVAAALNAFAGYASGDLAAGQGSADEAAALVDALPDAELVQRLDAAVWLGWAEAFVDRYDDALRHLSRAMTLARSAGQGYLLGQILVGQGVALMWKGRLQEAAERFDDAVEAALLAGSVEFHTRALTMRSWAAVATGDLADAMRFAEQAIAGGSSTVWGTARAPAFHARARLLAGHPEDVVETVLRAGGGPDLHPIDPGSRADWYEVLTRAELALGRVEEAEVWVRRAEQEAELAPLPRTIAAAGVARAALLLRQGDHAGAIAAAARVRQASEEGGLALGVARARLVEGNALLAAGERDAGIAVLNEALANLEACGARGMVAIVQTTLKELVSDVVETGGAGLSALSARERQVAALVASGHTNRQIAGELHLTENTVETHVRRIFRKLGISSRASLAAMVERDRT